jgi:hypothetical protein
MLDKFYDSKRRGCLNFIRFRRGANPGSISTTCLWLVFPTIIFQALHLRSLDCPNYRAFAPYIGHIQRFSNLFQSEMQRLFGHNILLVSALGAGKTLLARALPGILPEISIEESLDVTRIYSVADQLPAGAALIRHRPFRSPHHTISHAGLVGGGNIPKPGEISLAHRGVLFLDEFPEFGARVLEVMRQPMEDKVVTISRAKGSLTFSANFQLIAAMNPCPCSI